MQEKPRKRHQGEVVFATEEDFLNKFEEYVSICDKSQRLANIAGFAVFCRMNRDTFYHTKGRFPWAGGMIENILEDYTLNAPINHILKIFYMKSKFKYRDKPEEEMKDKSRVVIVDDLPECDDNE